MPDVDLALEDIQTLVTRLNERHAAVALQVNACFDSLMKTLEKRRGEVLDQLDTIVNYKQEILGEWFNISIC